MQQQVILYAPFDLGLELDLYAGLPGKEGTRDALAARLSRHAGVVDWRSDLPKKSPLSNYSGPEAEAPVSQRAFLAAGHVQPGAPISRRVEAILATLQLSLLDWTLYVQDYGIGIHELTVALDSVEWQGSGRCLGETWSRVCEHADLIEELRRMAGDLRDQVRSAAAAASVPEASDSVAAGATPDVLWIHALCLVDNRDGTFGEVGAHAWSREVQEAGVFPTAGNYFDNALAFKGASPVPFVTRHAEAAVIFGWGSSLIALRHASGTGDVHTLVPVTRVMVMLQSLAARLMKLNTDLLTEVTSNLHARRWHSLKVYQARLAKTHRLRLDAEVFLSLVSEYRYAQSRQAQVLWDQADRVWELDVLRASVRSNIEILKTLYEQRRSMLDEHIRSRVSNAVAVVTLLSIAAVAFTIGDAALGADWVRLALQLGIIVALGAISVFMFVTPRRFHALDGRLETYDRRRLS